MPARAFSLSTEYRMLLGTIVSGWLCVTLVHSPFQKLCRGDICDFCHAVPLIPQFVLIERLIKEPHFSLHSQNGRTVQRKDQGLPT